MPARNQVGVAGVDDVSEEDHDFLPPAFTTGRKHLRGPLSVDLVDSLRTAAASLAVAGPRSAESSDTDSDDELLMDVEVRTSGPDSGLLTNKSELKDDDEEEINHLQLNTDTAIIKNGNDIGNKDWDISKLYTAEKITHFNGLSSKELTKPVAEFDIPVSNFIEVTIENVDEINLDRAVFNGKQINHTSTENFFPFAQGNSHEISHEIMKRNSHEIKSPSKSAKTRFDNSSLSKLIEAALLEKETNDITIVPQTLDPKSSNESRKGNVGSNGYNPREFPKLKQMLTKGNVSEATLQFTKAMAMDNRKAQGSNHLYTSEIHGDLQNSCVNSYQVFNQINALDGTTVDNRACFKRCRADDCDTTCKEKVCLPPKKSKCFFTSPETFHHQNGVGMNCSRFLDNRDENREESNNVENTYRPATCRTPENGRRDPTDCGPRQCSQRIPPPAPLLPPCRVCGEKASGFHYGVNTCEACKGFFRRSLCRQEPYVCVSNGTCEVQSSRRTVCSHCRLKRCLDVGMSKNAIKTGRYTHELRSKNIMEVKQLQQQRERGTTAPVSEPLLPQIKVPEGAIKTTTPCSPELNEELQDTLDKLMMAQTYLFEFLDDYYDSDLILKRQIEVYNRYKKEKFDRQRNKANNLPLNAERTTSSNCCKSCDLLDKCDVISESVPSEPVKEQVLGTMIEDMERGIQGLVMFAKNIPGFVDLDMDDQSALLKAARFDIWYIGHIRCVNSNLRVGACEWYFHAEELEQVWGTKLVDMCFRLTDYGQKLDLTREETVALRAVSLTFADRCILKDRKAVEEIHAKLFQVFQYVASKRHPNFYKWLPDVINFLVYLREFGIEFDNKSCKMNIEWPVIQRNPLLLEVFFG